MPRNYIRKEPKCNACGVELFVGINWTASLRRNYTYRCMECDAEYQRAYWGVHTKERAENTRRYDLKSNYGVTPEQYDELWIEQLGKCATCGKNARAEALEVGKELHVAHNHNNGRIRGLPCRTCNRGIGYLRDDPILMRLAATYAEEFS